MSRADADVTQHDNESRPPTDVEANWRTLAAMQQYLAAHVWNRPKAPEPKAPEFGAWGEGQ